MELDVPGTSPPVPAAPSGLIASADGAQINLTWADNSTNEVNFLIERSTDGVNFTLIGAVTFAVTNFTDQNISPGTTCFYRVRAGNAGGYSGYSGIASAPLAFNAVYQSSGNLILSGFGGGAANPYYVLTSTNVGLPLAQWQLVATNNFGALGDFSITNAIEPGTPQLFYRVRLP